MKSLKDYINTINEASAEFAAKVKGLPYTDKEPTSDQDKYVAINGYGKTWKDDCGPFYVKIEDLGKYTDQAGLMSVAYNFIKDRDSKMTAAEVCAWDKDENKYMSFCYATLQKKNRSWHPEWVDWKVNESLVNEDRLGDEFADKAKYAEEDFKKWCTAAAKGYLFTEIGNLVLIYQTLEKPIQKDGYQIDIEHVATYNTKTHILYTDDMSLFGDERH